LVGPAYLNLDDDQDDSAYFIVARAAPGGEPRFDRIKSGDFTPNELREDEIGGLGRVPGELQIFDDEFEFVRACKIRWPTATRDQIVCGDDLADLLARAASHAKKRAGRPGTHFKADRTIVASSDKSKTPIAIRETRCMPIGY
jgi:hypothetical protein